MTDQKRNEDEGDGGKTPDSAPESVLDPRPESEIDPGDGAEAGSEAQASVTANVPPEMADDSADRSIEDAADYPTNPAFPHVAEADPDDVPPGGAASDAAGSDALSVPETEEPRTPEAAPWSDAWSWAPPKGERPEGAAQDRADPALDDASDEIPADNAIPAELSASDDSTGVGAVETGATAAADVARAGSREETPAEAVSNGVASNAQPPREILRETVVKKGGFVPGLIGGLIGGIAVALGAPYVLPPGWIPPPDTSAVEARLATLSDQFDSTTATVSALSGSVTGLRDSAATKDAVDALAAQVTGQTADIAGITAAVADISTEARDLTGRVGALSGSLDQLLARIDDLERRPIAESPDPTAVSAVQSYGREVAALREAFEASTATLRQEVDAVSAKAEEILQESIRQASKAREEAAALAERTAVQARRAARQQALIEIQSALETGQPFEAAMAGLDGVELPEGLRNAAGSGVDTLATLQADFPALAREALATSREALAGDNAADRGLSFLQRQLGVRSLAPRDGDGPDAVLSRAEAAVQQARLTDAVAELEKLPETARAVMQGWMGRAAARSAALNAANDLAAGLTPN